MMDVIIEQLKNLAEDFDQNEKRFYRELSESKVSINLLHAGLTRMERSLNIWKQKLNDMNAHASEFGSLIGNQNQLCGDAEQRFEAWLKNKKSAIDAEKAKVSAAKDAAAKKRLEEETEKNKAKAEVVAAKKAAEAAAKAEAEAAAKAEEEANAVAEAPASESAE